MRFVARVLREQLDGIETCSAGNRILRRRLAKRVLKVSPEVRVFVELLLTLYQRKGPMRRRMQNAPVTEAAKRTHDAANSVTHEVVKTFLSHESAQSSGGGAKVIRLPPFEGRESADLKAARREIIIRAAQKRRGLTQPPEAS